MTINILRIQTMTIGSAADATAHKLTDLELEQNIPVPDAAALNNVHPTTFERAFPHIIRRIGPRRKVVKLRHALNPPPP